VCNTEELTFLFDSNAKNPSYNAAVNFTENSLMLMFLSRRQLVETFRSIGSVLGTKNSRSRAYFC